MRHSLPRAPQFYVTAAQPCPYLEKKVERKLFTALTGSDSQLLNQALSQQGFRRSQNVLYRPSCADCTACLSARIPVNIFNLSKSQKRVKNKNKNIIRNVLKPLATTEQFNLFKLYLKSRHSSGGMTEMDAIEYTSMIEETNVKTFVCEYRIECYFENVKVNKLIGVSLTDILDDGLSMVYSFYDPKYQTRSLGKYMILDHIDLTVEMGLSNLYLGYWVHGSKKMDYKSQYSPLEIFKNGAWQKLDMENHFSSNEEEVRNDDPVTLHNKPIYLS